ncbi:DNA-binding transcriptional LysR family regulator [Raoultella sp. BIGb0399]|uniref:LysR family transcriptional regulator n=1 Tax=Raoultella sp. BIGb0399 TaxID=2485119 RepID=UPI000F4CA854|nr:LysR family transcriptional regulator [Raoultella sp. BIGb0399]ROS15274.1 DNA-binding transcriptional LysR family regulator [Raoultella sp. BIGb0399]
MSLELDIKILRAIHTLSTAGSVTKAAEMLQVTPGAVTYLINKARKTTGSALFFRTREGMKPNTLATELSQRYQSMMADYFPEESASSALNRAFIVSTYSLVEFLLALAWGKSAPKEADLSFVSTVGDDTQRLAGLRNKEVDIDIGSRLPVDSAIVQVKLFSSEVGMIARKDHPTINEKFTTKDWHENGHVLWSHGMHFISEDIAQTLDFRNLFDRQNKVWVSSSSLNVTLLCAYTNAISRMPVRIGRKLEAVLPVRIFSLPDDLHMTYECYLHYHQAFANDLTFQRVIERIQHSL